MKISEFKKPGQAGKSKIIIYYYSKSDDTEKEIATIRAMVILHSARKDSVLDREKRIPLLRTKMNNADGLTKTYTEFFITRSISDFSFQDCVHFPFTTPFPISLSVSLRVLNIFFLFVSNYLFHLHQYFQMQQIYLRLLFLLLFFLIKLLQCL